ncbi:DMT family transporter [Paenibacillus xerothermodurans]|uniref:DMT family transporter n=1 Tax=Paenibacillus xerothermodurans TaxID=1977292 RepID=A0A2W1N9F2_PAEXE|nr:DMT family transporter [Paenibacillus xerothermodurans]PZE20290.1 DMT family transporter [Paenibacillus xerothermodurans]
MNKGIVLAIGSSLVFSLMNVLVKEVSDTIPVAEIVFFRSVIGVLIMLIMMRQSKVVLTTHGVPLLALRGLLGALYMLAYFYTIAHIPLSDASILVHLSPIFVTLLSAIILKERLSAKTLRWMPLVVLGAILLVKPFQFGSYSLHALVGVLSALLAAGTAITIRYLSKRHHTYEIIFYFVATSTVVSIPLMWHDFVVPSMLDMLLLVCIGVVSLLGLVFLTTAFTHENAILVELTRYIGIVFNAAWGFALWAEVPDLLTAAGAACIISACIALSRQKPPAPKPVTPVPQTKPVQ